MNCLKSTLTFLSMFCLFSIGYSQKWIFIDEEYNGVMNYFDSETVKNEDGIIIIWLKEEIKTSKLTSFRTWKIKERKKFNLSVKGYDSYLYSLSKLEFDIDKRKYSILFDGDYNKAGIIKSFDYQNDNIVWYEIVPDSRIEEVFKKIKSEN
ncbi:MAG: hypothetical protein M3R72_00435 [Bacteroidota bacterium]|nr:hypothetical protein [Bacteroidota bacterium]